MFWKIVLWKISSISIKLPVGILRTIISTPHYNITGPKFIVQTVHTTTQTDIKGWLSLMGQFCNPCNLFKVVMRNGPVASVSHFWCCRLIDTFCDSSWYSVLGDGHWAHSHSEHANDTNNCLVLYNGQQNMPTSKCRYLFCGLYNSIPITGLSVGLS